MTLSRYLRTTLVCLLLSLLIGVLAAGQLILMEPGAAVTSSFVHAFIMSAPFWVFWAPVFPLIQILVARFPLERETMRHDIMVHGAAAILLSLAHKAVGVWFMHAIGHGYPRGHSFVVHFQEAVWRSGWLHLCAYLAMLGAVLVGDYYRRYRARTVLASQLQAQLAAAKLHALRMQLHPHFLFNTLNSIAMLTRRNENARAVRMIAGLGDLLRYVLEDAPADEVTLRDDVAFIERYLEIERVRFGDRLHVQVDMQESALDAFVPNLLLQPLVENAIKHGIGRKPAGGTIAITGARVGDRIVIEVSDDGPGMPPATVNGTGVGLANTRLRLEQLYADQASLDVANLATGGVRATIWLPYRAAARAALLADRVS
jgi:two-component system, LytTR family, sensor kinase